MEVAGLGLYSACRTPEPDRAACAAPLGQPEGPLSEAWMPEIPLHPYPGLPPQGPGATLLPATRFGSDALPPEALLSLPWVDVPISQVPPTLGRRMESRVLKMLPWGFRGLWTGPWSAGCLTRPHPQVPATQLCPCSRSLHPAGPAPTYCFHPGTCCCCLIWEAGPCCPWTPQSLPSALEKSLVAALLSLPGWSVAGG